jgi:hypothetical protein
LVFCCASISVTKPHYILLVRTRDDRRQTLIAI